MREKLLSKLMLLLAFMLVGAGNAWADDYVKVTSTSDITDGQYLIVYEDGNLAMNGGLTDKLDAVSNTIAVTIQDGKIASNANTDAAAFTYDATAKTFQSASGLYMGQTSDANGMQSSKETSYENAVSIDADGNAEIVSGGAYLRYNSASNQTRFRYYKSSSYTNQKTIQLYKLTTGGETPTPVVETVKTPTFNPAAGEVEEGTVVTIASETEGATIYYTTDGTTPTTASTKGNTVTVTEDVTIKAIAVKEGMNNSEVATAEYTVKVEVTPVVDVADLTLDFTEAWTAGDDNTAGEKVFTSGDYTISGKGDANFKFNAGYFFFGKQGAYVNLPKVDFEVEKIEVVGNSGASASTVHNIYVGETAVSTACTGMKETSIFEIAEGYQAANTQYVLKVESVHNAQVTYIKYYKKADASDPRVATILTIDATGITNTDLAAGTAAGKLLATVATDGTPIEGAVVAWESSNEGVATIENDGTVTLEDVGEVTFMATYAGDDANYYSSTATYKMNVINSRQPGMTADNPYTVAQARAAIDAGKGVKNVYAKGVVSEIVTAFDERYGNISYNISEDGSKDADQLQAYHGFSYNGENFTSADDIRVGDVVVIYGNLQKYKETYEFEANNQLVSLDRDETKQDAGLAYAEETYRANLGEGFTTPTLTNPNNLVVAYTSSNEKVATVDAASGRVTIVGTGVTTITATFDGNDNFFQDEASYTLTVVDPNANDGTAEKPYTVAEAIAFIGTLGNSTSPEDVYVKGIISQIDSYNDKYMSITYWISDDGEAENQMEVYSGKGLDGADFSGKDDLKLGDKVVVCGKVKMYNTIPEFDKNNYLVSHETTEVPVEVAEPTFSVAEGEVAAGTKVELVQKDAEEIWYTTDGTDPDFVTGAGEIYTEPIVVNETTTIKAIAVIGNYQSTVASATYTVVEVQPVAEYATLPFKFDGKVADIEGTEGLTHEGIDGKDYAKSPYLKFNTTGDYMVLKIDEVPGALTFDIQGNTFKDGTFSVQTSADGLTYTDVRTYSALLEGGTVHSELVNLKSDVRYIKWIYTEKVKGNVGIGNIELVADYKARVGEAGYATFVAPVAVDFAASGLTAYAVTEANAQGVVLEEVAAAPAGTPVVLQADAADYVLTLAERPIAPATNLLRASDGTTKGDGTIFALGVANDQAGFYRVAEGAAVAADKAYLQIDAATGAVRDFLAFIGTADAIQQVVAESENAPVYNLNGQRVQKAQRGIYVKNGRVFVVK